MDKYSWRIAIIAIITFSVAGFIVIKGFVHYIINLPKDEVVYLDTRHMQELSNRDLDSANLTLISDYLCNKTNKKDTSTLWVDAFVYAVDYRGHYSKPDTIVILDTALVHDEKHAAEYGVDMNDTIKRNIPRCRIVIRSDKIANIKRYKYKYKSLVLWED